MHVAIENLRIRKREARTAKKKIGGSARDGWQGFKA